MPIGMHAAWNFGQWALGEKDVPGLWRAVAQSGFESKMERANSISYIVVIVAVTLVFWRWYSRNVSRRSLADIRDAAFR